MSVGFVQWITRSKTNFVFIKLKIPLRQREAKERGEEYTQAQVQLNRQQLGINRGMMIFTGLLFLASLLSGLIAIFQAHVSQQAAKAAQDSANAAQTAADASFAAIDLQDEQMRRNRLTEARQEWLQSQTLGQNQEQFSQTLEQMRNQTQAQKDTAKSEANSVTVFYNESERALQLQSRPWIGIESVDAIILGNYGASTIPVSKVMIRAHIKNYGRTPVIRYIFEANNPTAEIQPVKAKVATACENPLRTFTKALNRGNSPVFPGNGRVADYTLIVSPAIVPHIYGCVIYQGTTDDTVHETVIQLSPTTRAPDPTKWVFEVIEAN
jgi:hypothetical protein